MSGALFDIEIDSSPFCSISPTRDWDYDVIPGLLPASPSLLSPTPELFQDISPTYLSRSPDAHPPPPAQSEDYNKVKLRYMQKLNFDKQQLAQRSMSEKKTITRDSRASSFPVPIPVSSPQTISIPQGDSSNYKVRKMRSATVQVTAFPVHQDDDETKRRNDPATFVPPHLLSNEASFSVQRFHDRKRLARLAF